MKLYFAGGEQGGTIEIIEDIVPDADILVSYYGLGMGKKDCSFLSREKGTIFLDSGAFSAFTKGVKIDIDVYINFIKQNRELFTIYNGLDVIGDWRKTKNNQEYMESKGLMPIPTFHGDSPLEELRRMCKKYSYIALGGLVPWSHTPTKLKKWLDSCFAVIKDYFPIKVHGFGINSIWTLKRYPFYSVDATSWKQTAIFGRFCKMEGTVTKPMQKENKAEAMSIRLRNYPSLEGKEKTSEYWNLIKKQIWELEKMREFVTKLWKVRGITWEK